MPIVAVGHEQHMGRVVGDGHCIAFVRQVTGLGPTATWRQGGLVRGGNLARGSAIATFGPDGRYENDVSGRSHAAILLAEHDDGLLVTDQWRGQPVHERTIRFRGGRGDKVNDGDAYFVIEVA